MSIARVPGLAMVRIVAPSTSMPSGSMRALTRSVSTSGQRGAVSSAPGSAEGEAEVEKVLETVMRPTIGVGRANGRGGSDHRHSATQISFATQISARPRESGDPGILSNELLRLYSCKPDLWD